MGFLVRMNETELRWLGYRWEELRGRHFTELLTPAGRAAFGERFSRFVAAGHIERPHRRFPAGLSPGRRRRRIDVERP